MARISNPPPIVILLILGPGGLLESKDPTVLDEDDAVSASLNYNLGDLGEGWVSVAEWALPGRCPMTLSLRAYHARSFTPGEKPDIDAIVCHLAWYVTDDNAQTAFNQEARGTLTTDALFDGIGERLSIATRQFQPFRDRSAFTNHRVQLVRGSFFVMLNSNFFEDWTPGRLADVLRSLDGKLISFLDSNPRSDGPVRTLKEKIKDPSRAPDCSKKCQVHNQQLEAVMVPVSFGLPVYFPMDERNRPEEARRRRFEEAKKRYFPNTSPEPTNGGCIVDELRDFTYACACPSCYDEAKKWQR